MSKIGLLTLLCVIAGRSIAQNYFVIIGSDNHQPFYVRVNDQLYSSSSEGHLILSQLRDSVYSITIGFPDRSAPEMHYTFNVGHKDQDFLLKNESGGGWRLYDQQAGDYIKPLLTNTTADMPRYAATKKDDAFSRMMAGVVHDTAVLYNTYAAVSQKSDMTPDKPSPADTAVARANAPKAAPDTAVAIVTPIKSAPDTTVTIAPPVKSASDTAVAIVTSNTAAATRIASDTAVALITAKDTALAVAGRDTTTRRQPPAGVLYRPIPPRPDSITSTTAADPLYRPLTGVTKISERKLTKSVRQVYADHTASGKADTIIVIIPLDTLPTAKNTATTRPTHAADTTHVPASRGHGPNSDSPILSQGIAARPTVPLTTPPADATRARTPDPADATRAHADSPRRQAKTIAYVNSDCHDFATDYDVDKLRTKMLYVTRDEDRLNVARKGFKIKCFYSRQVRTLSEVFTNDAAKFRFLEAAWPFAADEHFHELSSLLADPVYIAKFKTMTGHP